MGMPDGWERLPFIQDGWKKGEHRVYPPLWGEDGYVWIDARVSGEHGGFPDPVSCAVACELATGGCTDGHA